ncbi:uncharacterized protein TRAVEDRAFT_71063 [Trametes versicolor FP-101664 SS1]|uniref:uncharacterized protein n=1 Tax=Trametes versicolor (strain FP-101664) TaxID=717944 RepID=UPI0004622034|nr:uncharacterized protein TRAVEDRAFT_71063 [Trametes versicolor FP-101664 SS1]EIW60768.1 hypothetical protein TRAVEDRAFT_71063 [Trametes versicolor FP-101664 SS1]
MSSQPPEAKAPLPATILTALQQFTSQDSISSSSLHPFASNPEENIAALRKLLDTANQAALSLNAHLALPLSNPKLLSLYRQGTNISHAVQQADQNVRYVVSSLRKRVGITFGEDIPLERTQLPEWFLKRLLEWGTSAGMEAFNDPERDGHSTVVLGGKVLVVDIVFSVDRTDPIRPIVCVTTCKTSYAIPNSTATSSTGNSTSLDGFLAEAIRAFLNEVQKEDAQRDSVEAARLGNLLSDHLTYLMKLDHLAISEGDGGLRWFSFIDRMSVDVEKLASSEADALSRQEAGSKFPLDIFLMRSHALPLPYLTTPSISFLTYLSPLAYLKLLRTTPTSPAEAAHLPKLDVPFQHFRKFLTSHPRPHGVTTATLYLSPTAPPAYHADSMSMSALDTRSSSTLVPSAADMEHVFPAAREAQGPQGQQFTWLLDFTEGGKYPGVVMSQSRMHEIELAVNPFGAMDHLQSVQMLPFGSGSWVDLLLNSQTTISPERYTTVFTSPTAVHPPLQLRLTTPDEPGFMLEAVPVRSLKEVWSILEIVREQCWLNETLTSCTWIPEGLTLPETDTSDDMEVTESDLQSVLKGTVQPRSIPVNVYLPAHAPTDALFGGTDMDAFALGGAGPTRRARIVMTAPERPPISGLVEIGVTFDPGRPRGVAVDISGAMGVDLRVDVLEEVCRRGGVFGLPGRVWKKAHEML